MILIEKAKLIEKEADKMTKSSPERAALMYLDASEMLVIASQQMPQHERQLLTKANSLFKKSQNVEQIKEENKSRVNKTSDINFSSICGLEELKEEIRLKIIEPFKHPDIFKKYGKKIGGGILMYGPPGCGKSLISEATANEAEVTFFNVKASDLKSKYVGETEQNIARLFEDARNAQPAIIFFDEFEALGGERTTSNKYDKNAVSQLLQEMDGFGNKDSQILLLAATNEPWSIDTALLREGRFGTSIYVHSPDFEARKNIFKLNLQKRPLSNDVSYNVLASLTEGYSGADIMSICEAAAERALKDYLKTKKERHICLEDFTELLRKKESSIKPWYKNALNYLRNSTAREFYADLINHAHR